MNEKGEKHNIILSEGNSNIIDILRILGALLVLLGHCFNVFGVQWRDELFPRIQSLGVVFLFVLSGFLTIYSLERKNVDNCYQISTYIIARGKRIYSGLIPALIFVLILDTISVHIDWEAYQFPLDYSAKNWIGSLLMLQDAPIIGRFFHRFGTMRPLWTLRIEWWLYIGVGICYLVAKNKKQLKSIYLLPLLWIILNTGNDLFDDKISLAFLGGVMVYCLYDRFKMGLPVLFTFCLAILAVFRQLLNDQVYSPIMFLAVITIFLCLLIWGKRKGKRNKFLSEIAKWTYMLYLIHYTIIRFVQNIKVDLAENIRICISIFASIVFSVILYYGGEKTLLRLFNKISKK